jgi:LPXTG-site transpeptidase (sortase) family protein
MPSRGIRRARGGRSASRLVIVAVSIACVGAGLLLAGQIAWFFRSSSVHGAALVQRERRAISVAGHAARACQSLGPALHAPAAGGTPQGLLEIPVLGLVAPVLQGTGDPVLNQAVGHVPASAWPGQPGTSVLAAHDVTWFSGIGHLRAGDEIRYVMPCRTFAYRVTAHRIVYAGYPVYDTPGRIVLETCYPLDALYITGSRYLVFADLIGTSPTSPVPAPPASPAPLTVPAPKALAGEGLSLQQNETPLGVLRFAGSPSPGWRQTSAPLQGEASALTAYFALIRSAGQGERSWWADLAPSVPVSAAADLWDSEITAYDTPLDIRLCLRGDRVLGAMLTAVVSTAGSWPPGIYRLAVTETVRRGELLVSEFTMHRVG